MCIPGDNVGAPSPISKEPRVRRSTIAIGAVATLTASLSIALVPTASASTLAAKPDPAQLAVAAADGLVAAQSSQLRIGAGDALVRTGVHAGGNGLQYVSYARSYRGLPVVGGDAVVVTDAAG